MTTTETIIAEKLRAVKKLHSQVDALERINDFAKTLNYTFRRDQIVFASSACCCDYKGYLTEIAKGGAPWWINYKWMTEAELVDRYNANLSSNDSDDCEEVVQSSEQLQERYGWKEGTEYPLVVPPPGSKFTVHVPSTFY